MVCGFARCSAAIVAATTTSGDGGVVNAGVGPVAGDVAIIAAVKGCDVTSRLARRDAAIMTTETGSGDR